jgi:hypothetical protein
MRSRDQSSGMFMAPESSRRGRLSPVTAAAAPVEDHGDGSSWVSKTVNYPYTWAVELRGEKDNDNQAAVHFPCHRSRPDHRARELARPGPAHATNWRGLGGRSGNDNHKWDDPRRWGCLSNARCVLLRRNGSAAPIQRPLRALLLLVPAD